MEGSNDEEESLVNLFAAGDDAQPDYTIELMVVDRQELSQEGKTTPGFTPLLQRFDGGTKCRGLEGSVPRPPLQPLQVYFRNKRHSLWGHKLWNAARYLVKRIDSGMINVRGKTVLELGAGLGVPSLAAYRNGARCVVVTDYNDKELLEILQKNVEANCTREKLDPDAAASLAQEVACLEAACVSGRKEQPAAKNEAIVENVDEETPLNTRCFVQPLLWGNVEHIREALQHTGGAGFDLLLLSDILFNHICNDHLADTVISLLQRSPKAAAYCAFSHHRAHKQVEDLMFFDKCAARGLQYEQIDEEDYPLMFPDDRGPEEIRRPVKVYKLTHRYDAAGAPLQLGEDNYDVVVQGTGMVECLIAAALARNGVQVLQCDAQEEYGGSFKTLTISQMRQYLKCSGDTSNGTSSTRYQYTGVGQQAGDHHTGGGKDCGGDNDTNIDGDGNITTISVDLMDTLDVRTQHRFLLDLLPMHYFSNGDTVRKFMESDMARHAEFQRCSSFAFLLRSTDAADGSLFRLQSVPLTRAQVFSADHIALMQKRRLMKFVKDIAAPLAEHVHAHNAGVGEEELGHTTVQEVGELLRQEAAAHPDETLSDLLRRKYAADETMVNIVTLLGELETSYEPCMLRAVDLVRQVLTSVGAHGGSTPFLVPVYGASDVPQNMCRIAAVWGAVFVLRRSVNRVLRGFGTPMVQMSNYQHVKAKVVVVPRTLAAMFSQAPHEDVPSDLEVACFSRVIIVASKPLISWEALRSSGCCEDHRGTTAEDVREAHRASELDVVPPIVFALCQVRPGVVVHVQQLSASSEQAPNNGAVVVHFTIDNRHMSAQQLHQFVEQSFISPSSSASGDDVMLEKSSLLFFASFVLNEREEALRSTAKEGWNTPSSETEKAHPFAVEEYCKRKAQRNCDVDDLDDDSTLVVPVPTLLQNLMNDGAYLKAAQQAYQVVIARLQKGEESTETKRYVFLDRLPPVMSVDS